MLRIRFSALLFLVSALLTSCFTVFGQDHSILVIVNGHSGPWNYGNGHVNPSYHYGADDQQSPAVINSASGFAFTPGSEFTITYVSGSVSPGSSYSFYDANGDTAYPFNNTIGPNGTYAPSFYMDPATYPINLAELVGTFADRNGKIVGRPFAIGYGPLTMQVPFGASALQLGVNDVIYADNTGAFLVKIHGQAAAGLTER